MMRRAKGQRADHLLQQAGQEQLESRELHGFYKGIVEDNEDPFSLGRCKVRVFSLHGPCSRIPTRSLPWTTPIFTAEFHVPELYERVWVSFENGDRHSPVYIGRWFAIPAGKGSVYPHNKRIGTEVPREAWSQHNLRPNAQIVARSREGDSIWMDKAPIGGRLHSRIVAQGIGGNTLSLESYIYGDNSTAYDALRTEQGGENPTEYRTKELQHRSQMGRAGRLQLGQPGAQQSWLHSRDHVVIERRETSHGTQYGTEAVDTVIDGSVSHSYLGDRGSDVQNLRVATPQNSVFVAPRSIALVAQSVLALPPVW